MRETVIKTILYVALAIAGIACICLPMKLMFRDGGMIDLLMLFISDAFVVYFWYTSEYFEEKIKTEKAWMKIHKPNLSELKNVAITAMAITLIASALNLMLAY